MTWEELGKGEHIQICRGRAWCKSHRENFQKIIRDMGRVPAERDTLYKKIKIL
jgi:2-iminoacetate synthase ThiH